MTLSDSLALAGTVALVAAIAWLDPAGPRSRAAARRWLSRAVLALALGLNRTASRLLDLAERLTPTPAAAPPAPAPAPPAAVFGVEVLVDREIWLTNAVVLGTYLRQASKATREVA